jgi:hypothetical protein
MSMLNNFKVIAAGITGNLGRYECQRSLNTFAIVNLPTLAVLSLWVARPVSSGRIWLLTVASMYIPASVCQTWLTIDSSLT